MREPFPKARVIITILLMTEVLLGLGIIVGTSCAQIVLRSFLASNDHKALSSQFFNGYILGAQLIVTYLCSMGMWRRIWQRRCTNSIKLLLNIWMFFCFLIVICGFGSIWTLITSGESLERSVDTALRKGIDMYYACPDWKLLWDSLQYHRQCCGVHDYKDWMKAKWMPPEEEQCEEDGNETNVEVQPKRVTVLAPYACCKHNCNSCYQNYVPGAPSGPSKIPDLKLEQINMEGCMSQFSESLWKTLYWLLGMVIVAFKIDLIICGLTKIIMKKQCGQEDSGGDALTDDEGHPLVLVKCPANVRCVTLDDNDSSAGHCGCDGKESSCICCLRRSSDREKYKVQQEKVKSRGPRILH